MLHILVIVKVVTDVCGEHVKFKVNNIQCISEPLTTATNLSFKCDNLSAERDNEAEDIVKIIPAYMNMFLF